MNEKASRANIAPPKAKTPASFLPVTEEPVGASKNMSGSKIVMMSFNMPFDWHTRFKTTAASRGLSMKDLLVECFAAWEKQERGK